MAEESSLYVTGLPKDVTEEQVKEVFGKYDTVSFCKVLRAQPDKPDGAAVVCFENAEKAKFVIESVSGTVPEGLHAPVEIKLKKRSWKSWEEPLNDTLYVTGLPSGSDEEAVKAIFSNYGPVKFVKVLPAQPDKIDVAAIVSMESPEQAKTLIANVSGTVPEGLAEPITIKAKINNQNSWGKGWGKGYNPNDPWSPLTSMLWSPFAFGKGGGKGGKGWGKGWGGGGGGGLSSFPAEKKVWIGGLPEDVTYQELLDHFGGAGKAKYAIAMKGNGAGTGGVGFGTPEDASAAIQSLNGSLLKGSTLVVDVWTKKTDTAVDTP